jgi:tetratricopeptide (TPR) repeat protein
MLNRTLPESVDAVLARGMAKRPEQRWPSAQDFAQALETALTDATTKTHRRIAAAAVARPARGAHPTASRQPATSRQPTGSRQPTATRRAAPRTGAQPPTAARRAPGRRRGRVLALAALVLGAVAAVAIAGTLGSSGRSPQQSASVQRQASAATHRHAPATTKPAAPKPHTTSTQTVTATPAAATTTPPTADTLEARGHQLMLDGNYSAALPVLRQAVNSASPNSLTYAYALYDYGRTLLLAGDPKDAVKVLYQRLQIPNQTGAVRQELQLALVALGQNVRSGGAGATPPGHRKHHGGPGVGPPGGGPGPGPGAGPQPPGQAGGAQGD